MWEAVLHFEILVENFDYTDVIHFHVSFLLWTWQEMTLYLEKKGWVPLFFT